VDEIAAETLSDRQIAEETLRLLRKFDATMTALEPLIAQYSNPVSAYLGARRRQKAGANGG
jgi:hypothetical protein